eukprot:COSAG06_NODE_3695_length_4999_cov_8.221837_4_plen_173_part_00
MRQILSRTFSSLPRTPAGARPRKARATVCTEAEHAYPRRRLRLRYGTAPAPATPSTRSHARTCSHSRRSDCQRRMSVQCRAPSWTSGRPNGSSAFSLTRSAAAMRCNRCLSTIIRTRRQSSERPGRRRGSGVRGVDAQIDRERPWRNWISIARRRLEPGTEPRCGRGGASAC